MNDILQNPIKLGKTGPIYCCPCTVCSFSLCKDCYMKESSASGPSSRRRKKDSDDKTDVHAAVNLKGNDTLWHLGSEYYGQPMVKDYSQGCNVCARQYELE